MSAFNDYCIFCDKICTTHSIYCSEECRQKDQTTHYEFNNVPALISPNLQPRSDFIANALSNDEAEDDDEYSHSEYLIKSPLLLAPATKNQEKIVGLSLNDSTPRSGNEIDTQPQTERQSASVLATSSNNYKKWLQNHS